MAYLNEVPNTDRMVGRLLDAIAGSPSLAASTVCTH